MPRVKGRVKIIGESERKSYKPIRQKEGERQSGTNTRADRESRQDCGSEGSECVRAKVHI